jgi:transcriptional regulator with XRE-family HTH domain
MHLRLKEWRLARGHSLRTLAAKAGVSYVTVARIEAGTMSPTVDMLAKLARALKVHIIDLFPRPRQRR